MPVFNRAQKMHAIQGYCQRNLRNKLSSAKLKEAFHRVRFSLRREKQAYSHVPFHTYYLHFLRGGFPSPGYCSVMLCSPEKQVGMCPRLTWKFAGAEVFISKIHSLDNYLYILWCLVCIGSTTGCTRSYLCLLSREATINTCEVLHWEVKNSLQHHH